MLWRRRPKVRKLARKGNAKRLVRALGYHDQLSDSHGRLYDLGAGIRRDAALSLTSVADTPEVDVGAALIAALGDASGEVRRAAASALGARREGRGATVLAEAALTWRDPRYEAARRAATDALIDLSGPESVEQVVLMLVEQSADPVRARELVTRMVEEGGEETARSACAAAASALATSDLASAARAAEVLTWLGRTGTHPLLEALGEVQPKRVPVIEALGRMGDLQAAPPLTRLLSDGDAEVRRAAAAALGQIADPGSARGLTRATGDPDRAVRTAALEAIGRLGPLAVEPPPSAAEPVSAEPATTTSVAPDPATEVENGGRREAQWLDFSRL